MTEAQWLTCTHLPYMMHFLEGKASNRKLRLFACACCRLTWHLLPDVCHRLVEAAEQFADGLIGAVEVVALFKNSFEHLNKGYWDLRRAPGDIQAG